MCFALKLDELLTQRLPDSPIQDLERPLIFCATKEPFQHPSTEPGQWYLTPYLTRHLCNDRRLFLPGFFEAAPMTSIKQNVMGRGCVEMTFVFDGVVVGLRLVQVLYVPGSGKNCVSTMLFERSFLNDRHAMCILQLKQYIDELETIITCADGEAEASIEGHPAFWVTC